uniref:Serine/threonine-protein kinase PBS1 n=1 Tax=Aegilops tauschii TaxID=37682 RepID=M8C801_AEGTA
MWRLACVVVLLLASLLGSTGTDLAPAPAVGNSPVDQGHASSPPGPSSALGPVTLPAAPPTPSASPPLQKGAVSPAVSPAGAAGRTGSGSNAPPPVVSAPPPVVSAPPPVVFLSPPVEPAPPPAVIEGVPPAAAPPPQAAAGNPAPILPGSPALLPSVQAPAPSVAVKPNLPLPPPASLPSVQAPTPSVAVKPNVPLAPPPSIPSVQAPAPSVAVKPNVPLVPPPSLSSVQAPAPSVAVKPNVPLAPPPSVNNQPGRPIGSGNDIPPYPPPEGIFPAVPPSTSVPPEHVKPPISPPIIAHAPQQQAQAPNAEHKNGNTAPPANTSPPASGKNHDIQRAPPPKEPSTAPVHKSPIRASPLPHNTNMPTLPRNASTVPHAEPPSLGVAPKPAPTSRSHPPTPTKGERRSFSPSYPPPHAQGPEVSRAQPPQQVGAKRQNHHAPPPMIQGHPNLHVHPPSPPPVSPKGPSNGSKNCKSLVCPEPLTDPPAGAPCACVLPIKVGIRLSVDLYSFFPLVSDFADEVGSGVNMARRQVRVMGANVAGDQPDKTVVLVHLVPMHVNFDKATALLTFQSLWSKKISLKPSVFGDYEILYVVYPGLPPSPPSAPAGAFGNSRNARAMKPLGVDVGKPPKKVNGSVIAIAVLSTVIALIICTVAAWLLILRFRDSDDMAQGYPHSAIPKISRSSGTCNTLLAGRRSTQSGPSSSLGSSMAAYTGQAKTFKFAEIEKATNGFDDSSIVGEGGFGCVYQGTLEDGTTVAVKVLKRFDGQGEREFLAEVEMLGRLHHRNLVKLLGICVEENARCLVYELIPNGSVESHLHGADREIAPLDWNARMKIALGAGRALAYLHEDSSPCVIHRDFKSSNILLEHDFTPKVSDFGLARTARGEGNQHISTRVMGTFGYVAPEYAMTGHLLVKSDVYSYGVVLLELLTGRKPVDMSQPAGQESLVAWARPYLTNVVGLRQAVDPLLGPNVPLDNVAKAAAIASMCVQPEVAHRPSMSEVVQALKLVCSEGDEGLGSGSFSQELAARTTAAHDVTGMEAERVLLSEMFGSTPVFTPAADSGSFRMQSSSGPLMTGKNKKFWQRMRNLSRGSMSEHGASPDFETHSQCSNR